MSKERLSLRQGLSQEQQPFVEALLAYKEEHMVPFHTPGHKIGVGAPSLLASWMGPALPYDLGVMYALDDLHEPEGALKDAQDLAAELYGADHTLFSINGTTAIIQAMIMGTVQAGDGILIPREAHRSVMGGIVLSGATPVYMEGRWDPTYGVPLGVTPEMLRQSLQASPSVKAVLFVNPNYYGITTDLKALVDIAHDAGCVVLVDEAHGAHLPWLPPGGPMPALACGADLVAQSTHKLVGSLTQTSMLHGQGDRIAWRKVVQAHQLLQSTSPNYIFLASLDMARHQLAMEGTELVGKAAALAETLREGLSQIAGIACPAWPGMDRTKVTIDFRGVGLTAVEAEKQLRAHGIEVELMSQHHVLVLITFGDTEDSIRRLLQAVTAVAETQQGAKAVAAVVDEMPLPTPVMGCTPRDAFFQDVETVPLQDARGLFAGETITYYPPGIPVVSVGEVITEEVIHYMTHKQQQGYVPNGAADPTLATIRISVQKKG